MHDGNYVKIGVNRMILSEKSKLFYNFYVNSPLAYQLLNEYGYLIDVNQGWLKLMGYLKEEVINRHFSEFLVQDWQKKCPQFQEDSEIWKQEYVMWRKDGTLVNISLDSRIDYNPDGFSAVVHCILYDISQRKKMEEKFRESQDHYRILAENMEDVVWRVDLQKMKILYVSPSIERLRGYRPEEVIEKTVQECFTPESYAYLQQILPINLERAIADQKECTFITDTFEQPCKDGTTVWVEISSRIFYGDGGKLEAIGVSRNYNKQRQQQQELDAAIKSLKQRKALTRTIMDTAPCILVSIGKDGKIQYINKACAEKFNKDQDNSRQLSLADFLPPHLHEKHISLLAECLQGASIAFTDEMSVPSNPECRCFYGIYNPFLNSDGEVERVVIAAMDITEQKQMEKQLAEAQRIGKIGSWEWNLQKEYFVCSEGLCILFEVGLEEVEAFSYHAFLDRIHPDDMIKVKKVLQRLLLNHLPINWKFRLLCPNGTSRVLQLTSSVSLDCDSNPLKITGMVVDITHYMQLEEAQKEAGIRLREFAQTIAGISFIIDEDGQIIELFGQEYFLLGKVEGELIGSELNRFMSPKTAEEFLYTIKQAIQMATLQFGEYEFHTKEGKRTFEVRIAPMSYRIGGKMTVACHAIDTTEKKFTQKILQVSYEKRRQKDLLNGLIEGKIIPSQSVLDEAWRVKLNLAQSFSCYLLLFRGWQGESMAYWQEHRDRFQFLIDSVIEVLSEQTEGVVWESKDGIVILNPVPFPCKDIQQYEKEVASSLQEIIHTDFPDAVLSIGIAEFYPETFWQIEKIYSQACNAAYLGGNLFNGSHIHHYLDLGVFQILPFLSDQEQVHSFIQRNIGKLLEYDQEKGSHLMATLEKILQNDNLKVVAEQLFVHHKTVVFRKKRIEEILGISLDEFETKLALSTALKLRQAFGHR